VTQELKHFVYAHRGFQYALPVGNVLEIVEIPALLPFHGTMRGTLGNIIHRGFLLPVLDATTLATSQGVGPERQAGTVVVIQQDGVLCALAIDRFVTVVQLGAGASGLAETDAADVVTKRPGGERALVAGDGRDNIVETVLGFRNNSLIVLSVTALTQMVRERFGDQHLLDEDVEAAALVDDAADGVSEGYLCAAIGNIVLGIPIGPVVEVIENYEVTQLFMVDPSLRGARGARHLQRPELAAARARGSQSVRRGEGRQYRVRDLRRQSCRTATCPAGECAGH
jgi:hypothetical protein